MESNLENCPIGILVDFEETAITISPDGKKELNRELSDSDGVSFKHGTEKLFLGHQTELINGGVHKIANGNCLGAELNNAEEVCFSKMEWRSPSPTTMSMITKEATKIVDQLHTTLETSLWEEELSMSFVSEDECLDEAPYKDSSQNKMLEQACNSIEGLSFKKENDISQYNSVLENLKAEDDNSVCKENKEASQAKSTINTCDENVTSAMEKYATAKNSSESSSENCTKIEETVSSQKYCVRECSAISLLNNVESGEHQIHCLAKTSISTKSSLEPKDESNFTIDVGSTEVNHLTNQDNDSSFTKKSSVALNVLNGVSSDVDNGICTTTKKSMKLVESDLIVSIKEISISSEVNSKALFDIDDKDPDEVDGNAANEVIDSSSNEVERNGTNEVNGNSSNEVKGNSSNEVKGNAPNEVNSSASCQVDDINQNEVENKIFIGDTLNNEKNVSNTAISNTEENNNLSVFGEDKEKLAALTSKSKNDKCLENTPSTKKSKLTKFFKTPSFKSPFKAKLEGKENTSKDIKQGSLPAKNMSKIGQVPSTKSVISASNKKGSMTLSNPIIKTPLNKSSLGRVPLGRENKASVKLSLDQSKPKLQTFDTPSKRMSLAKFQPPLNAKTPLGKSYSLRAKTPNTTGTAIRRSSSFQTGQAENSYQFKKERSFVGESRLQNFNSRMSLAQTQPIGNKLRYDTPSKIAPFPLKSTANTTGFGTPFTSTSKCSSKELQSCNTTFSSALRPTNYPTQSVPEVVGLKRPASTTSKTRFTSRLGLPSPLPKMLNDNLSRKLFPDYSTPLKRKV